MRHQSYTESHSTDFNAVNESQINNDELKTCKQDDLSSVYQWQDDSQNICWEQWEWRWREEWSV